MSDTSVNNEALHKTLADAFTAKGVDISAAQLTALANHVALDKPLGLGIDTTINVPISNGSGSYSVSYPSFWLTANATLKITAPNNADQWQVTAYDDYTGKTIWSGKVGYNQPVNVSYKTSIKINLRVTANNVTEPNFNGTLSVLAQVSI